MTVREYYGLEGKLTNGIGSGMLVLFVSPNVSGAVADSGFVNGTDVSYFSLSAGDQFEIVKLISLDGDQFTVERAQLGTTAKAFPLGAKIKYEVTSAAIIAQIGAISTTVTIVGEGAATVQQLAINNYKVIVPPLNLTGDNNRLQVLGVYPDLQITYTAPDSDCCGEGGSSSGDGITSLQGEGIAVAFATGGQGTVRVTPPVFTAGPNISIVGAWPNYTISATAGSGTVSSVTAGTGLTLTGSATVNPTLSISNTGVVAGTYGGVGINARGQITTVPTTFNPVSIILAGGSGELDISRIGDEVTITADTADIGAKGVVALADHTDPFDPSNVTEAVTPAYLNMALESLVLPAVGGANSYTSEADASYTNSVGGSATVIALLAGEKAFIYAEVTMLDSTTPTNPVNFGLAVFTNADVKVKGNKTVNQCQQSLGFVIDGPLSATLLLKTTAIPAGASVVSSSLVVQTF